MFMHNKKRRRKNKRRKEILIILITIYKSKGGQGAWIKNSVVRILLILQRFIRGGGNSEGEVSITPLKSITSANTLPPSF